jgi:hypothetical protein
MHDIAVLAINARSAPTLTLLYTASLPVDSQPWQHLNLRAWLVMAQGQFPQHTPQGWLVLVPLWCARRGRRVAPGGRTVSETTSPENYVALLRSSLLAIMDLYSQALMHGMIMRYASSG